MKKILFIVSLLLIFLCSCEKKEIENTDNPFSLKLTSDNKIENELESFLISEYEIIQNIKGSANKIKFESLTDEFNLSEQQIIENSESNQAVILISSIISDADKLVFFKDSSGVNQAIKMELLEVIPDEEVTFICSDIHGNQIFKGKFDYVSKTYTVIEIYETKNNIKGLVPLPPKTKMWGCNLTMGTAGLVWSAGFGMITAGAGFIVGASWLVLQTWICS